MTFPISPECRKFLNLKEGQEPMFVVLTRVQEPLKEGEGVDSQVPEKGLIGFSWEDSFQYKNFLGSWKEEETWYLCAVHPNDQKDYYSNVHVSKAWVLFAGPREWFFFALSDFPQRTQTILKGLKTFQEEETRKIREADSLRWEAIEREGVPEGIVLRNVIELDGSVTDGKTLLNLLLSGEEIRATHKEAPFSGDSPFFWGLWVF